MWLKQKSPNPTPLKLCQKFRQDLKLYKVLPIEQIFREKLSSRGILTAKDLVRHFDQVRVEGGNCSSPTSSDSPTNLYTVSYEVETT